MAKSVNGVDTSFRSKNHKYNTLRGMIDIYQRTRSLDMGMGRC